MKLNNGRKQVHVSLWGSSLSYMKGRTDTSDMVYSYVRFIEYSQFFGILQEEFENELAEAILGIESSIAHLLVEKVYDE